MTTTTSTPNFFQKLLTSIVDFFETKVVPIEQHIATFADTVTNKIKALAPTAEALGAFLENDLAPIAEAISPALTPIISGIELEIPKIITTVVNTGNIATVVEGELTKPINEQAADALAALQNSKLAAGTPSTVQAAYAGALTTIASAISGFVTSNNEIEATPADLLSTAVAVHAQTPTE